MCGYIYVHNGDRFHLKLSKQSRSLSVNRDAIDSLNAADDLIMELAPVRRGNFYSTKYY